MDCARGKSQSAVHFKIVKFDLQCTFYATYRYMNMKWQMLPPMTNK